MDVEPDQLVTFGDAYLLSGDVRFAEEIVGLTDTRGLSLAMRFGVVAIADPWYPEPRTGSRALVG